MKLSLALLSVIAAAQAAYVPSEPWSTLTPSKTASGAMTDHTAKFGISIQTVASATSGAAKRDVVNQIGDGQIQKQTSQTLVTPTTTASVVNQIGDGQIQHQTSKKATTTASVINQIGDGQIQNQSATKATTTASVVNQIGDGQIQHQTASTASVVNQIGDGQIQHQTASTASAVNQIGDGQIQHQTVDAASQINDGQVQATGVPTADEVTDGFPVACLTDNSLTMSLKGGILTDSKDRVGAIVANYQFQFDGPPQAGTIYAAGWSISDSGLLTLGDEDLFYQCKSGDFYNLYYFENSADINAQCEPVHLSVIELVSC